MLKGRAQMKTMVGFEGIFLRNFSGTFCFALLLGVSLEGYGLNRVFSGSNDQERSARCEEEGDQGCLEEGEDSLKMPFLQEFDAKEFEDFPRGLGSEDMGAGTLGHDEEQGPVIILDDNDTRKSFTVQA
jgi:hypothetical protein